VTITPDAWLTETLGRPAYAVHAPASAAQLLDALQAHQSTADAFYFAKVPVLNVDAVKALEGAGFSTVETTLAFSRPSGLPVAPAPPGVAVSLLQPRWNTDVLDIAESAFKYTRFHVDARVGLSTANRVKRAWIQSYIDGRRGDALFVAHDGDRVLGFNAMLVADRPGEPAAVIDLIAVHPDHQQRGIGIALIAAAIVHYQARCPVVEVSTQASNIPSVRLYESLGFRLIRSTFVLHRHGPDANRRG
jgi:GNAT superfamily N-acetyltransferase